MEEWHLVATELARLVLDLRRVGCFDECLDCLDEVEALYTAFCLAVPNDSNVESDDDFFFLTDFEQIPD